MAKVVENGYPIFTDLDGGPLDEGYLFIGFAGFNPLTNPQDAFWDEDLTVPAVNIRTNGGYAQYQGSPSRLFTAAPFSLLVRDKEGQTVYYQPYSLSDDASAGVVHTGVAGEALTAFKLVYRGSTDGKFYIADPTNRYKSFVSGFALTSVGVGDDIEVFNKGVLGGLAGLVVGTDYYLDDAGAYAALSSLGDTDNIVRIGRAVSISEMEVSIPPPLSYVSASPVDISAADQTSDPLPLASVSLGQRLRFGWYGGDGSNTFEVSTSENLIFPNGTARTATQAAGEGDGYIEVECDGTQWNVVGYEDYFAPAVSGNWDINNWAKHLNGKVTFNGRVSESLAMTTASGTWYRSPATTEAWPVKLGLASIDSAAGLQLTSGSNNNPFSQVDNANTDATNLSYFAWRGSSATANAITIVTLTGANWF